MVDGDDNVGPLPTEMVKTKEAAVDEDSVGPTPSEMTTHLSPNDTVGPLPSEMMNSEETGEDVPEVGGKRKMPDEDDDIVGPLPSEMVSSVQIQKKRKRKGTFFCIG